MDRALVVLGAAFEGRPMAKQDSRAGSVGRVMTLSATKPSTGQVGCALMPHAPIVIPAVAGADQARVRATTTACRTAARRLLTHSPRTLVVVSPHAPRQPTAFGVWTGDRLRGDLAAFGVPATIDLANDTATATGIERAAAALGVATWRIPPRPLDHGALVPLWFLVEAGWHGPTCVTSLPGESPSGTLATFGRAIRGVLGARPSVLVASGDMSHRLQPGAPAGFDPRAHEFDDWLRQLVAVGRLESVASIDASLRALAAEDAADSVLVAAGAIAGERHGCRVLSYEHPFGVGYLVAILLEPIPILEITQEVTP
jgi:aromatic ring-opening dioxygenase LigB subunit